MYLWWHYSRGIISLFQIWTNFVWFIYHFFSLRILVATWFSPWRRLSEHYAKGASMQSWAEALVVNSLMRVVGFALRSIILLFGVIVLLLVVVAIIPIFILWLVLPWLVIALFLAGLIGLLFLVP